MILYSQILEFGGPAFGTILCHVRDKPNSPFVFHCTGSFIFPLLYRETLISTQLGKIEQESSLPSFSRYPIFVRPFQHDRLISFQLAGVDNHLIAQDYSLTRVGREPDRAKVLERLLKEPLFAANSEAAMRMLTSR